MSTETWMGGERDTRDLFIEEKNRVRVTKAATHCDTHARAPSRHTHIQREGGNRARVTKAARFTGRTAFLNPRLSLSGGQSQETETIRRDSVKDQDFDKAFRFDQDEDQKPPCICHSIPQVLCRVLCPQTQRRRLQFNMASSNIRLSVPLPSRRHKGQHSQVPCSQTYRTQRRRLQFKCQKVQLSAIGRNQVQVDDAATPTAVQRGNIVKNIGFIVPVLKSPG